MEWYLKVLQNYAGFQGRARRKEYWIFFLLNFIIGLVLGFVSGLFGIPNILGYLYALAVLIPSIALVFRRLHDTGKSGWWILISFVPIAGTIILLVFMCLDSDEGTNQYGTNPKY
ncbi:uncharacterized membrane protein YhaH (DUF805 family) [Fontibacillus phaseoli]|uniref:Uncharacterized membrane protein YhaH (DUF805 family) n=1 Tax=Fontibacillus phaseoli TaxID=1416533 RepID=A0A369BKV9_9BACL|nr:DUF805 domain-containing protein [Fontibacillus phaseoli]RCX20334.1 uncharacterized membrane protein YhaH (DUF805 family) [Fontibacillus phaseoli]